MSNDPFAEHGIDHLSPSSINAYINDPCIWIMRYLYGFRNGGGPAMWRGTCVDHAVGHFYGRGIKEKPLTKPEAIKEAEIEYQRLLHYCHKEYPDQIIDDVKFGREQKLIGSFTETAIDFYSRLGEPDEYQKQIELNIDSIPVPITGYIDLQYGDIIRDIKTTMRLPSSVSDAHARQVSVYAKATDSNHAMLDYVVASAKKQEVVSMPVLNIDGHIKVVEDIALAIMNLLSISNDKSVIAKCFYPDTSSWMWGEDEKRFAKTIWSM
jgi:hypothetical protein